MKEKLKAPSMNDITICFCCKGKGTYYASLPDEEGDYPCYRCDGKGYTVKKQ